MNIFAKIVHCSEENVKDILINELQLGTPTYKENLEIYSKNLEDHHLILTYTNNIDQLFDYVLSSYEVVNFYNISSALKLENLDLQYGDVIIPNTFIDKNNTPIFFPELTSVNYDLKNFGLSLNGICLTLDFIPKDKATMQEILLEYGAEVLDDDSYYIAQKLQEFELINKSIIIKTIGNESTTFENGVQILQIML